MVDVQITFEDRLPLDVQRRLLALNCSFELKLSFSRSLAGLRPDQQEVALDTIEAHVAAVKAEQSASG